MRDGAPWEISGQRLKREWRSLPRLATEERRRLLRVLLPDGDLTTPELERLCSALADAFAAYLARYPFGLWRSGLVVTPEMHRLTEQYLPLAAIWRGWRQVSAMATEDGPAMARAAFCSHASWLAVLAKLGEVGTMAPHRLLRDMAVDEQLRERLLFAWQLPRHHGGGFGRYPEQLAWLAEWLRDRHRQGATTLACLDAACGSGEGTYELAALLSRAGLPDSAWQVRGVSLQSLEVAAAALAYFPHDPQRQDRYRCELARLLPVGALARISFAREDLLLVEDDVMRYDVILCNGLLGGPLLHGKGAVADVVRQLARRLRPGGVLLAADRFHEGWRKEVPLTAIRECLRGGGLMPLMVPEGVGGAAPV